MMRALRGTGLAVLLGLWVPLAEAAGVGKVVYASGEAWIERAGERIAAEPGLRLEKRDFVVTGGRGRVKLVLADGSRVYVGARSRLEMAKYARRGSRLAAAWNMFWGRARFFVRRITGEGEFTVRTATAVLGVRGTSFLVLVPQPTNVQQLIRQRPQVLRDFDAFRNQVRVPARVVLHTGRLEVQTIAGARTQLSAGRVADVDARGNVRVHRAGEGAERTMPMLPQEGVRKEEKPEKKEGVPQEGKRQGAVTEEKRLKAGKTGEKQAPPALKREAQKKPSAPPAPPVAPQPRPKPTIVPPPVQPAKGADLGTALKDAKQNLGPNTKVKIQPRFVLP